MKQLSYFGILSYFSAVIFIVTIQLTLQAQIPQKFNYQAVARNINGIPLTNTAISVRLNINNLTANGTTLYSERHDVITNSLGLFSLETGGGTVLSGSFTGIDWATGNKYLETALDADGAAGGYSFVIMGATQLISVPYSIISDETRWLKVSETNLKVGNSGYSMTGEFNTTIGTNALNLNTTGISNTATGSYALYSNTEGEYNTANGAHALYFNTTGNYNTAIGKHALVFNVEGNYNTATGAHALEYSTISNANTANGYEALTNNYTGNLNCATGFKALYSNTHGSLNTAIGSNALYNNTTADNNTAVGYSSLLSNTIGINNTAVGISTLLLNDTGEFNTAVGADALYYNTIGNNNTALGNRALFLNDTGYDNTATGIYALYNNSTGYLNTANGKSALFYNETGYDNTANGVETLFSNIMGSGNAATGKGALYNNISGNYNTAFGKNALLTNTTGTLNSALGYNAYPTTISLSNYTGLGYFVGSGSSSNNMVEIGNTSVSVIRGQVLPTIYSDGRIKDNISADVPGLTFIAKLRPVTYNLNIHRQNDMMYGTQKPDTLDWEGKYDIEKIKMTGFIAQEVAKAAQEVDFNFSGIYQPKSENDLYGLSYSAFVVPLVKAVQEQQTMINQQNAINEKLQQEIQQLKSNAAKLEAELELIKSKLGF